MHLHPCITLAFFLSGDLEASDSRRYSKCQTASDSQTFPKPPQAPFETSINWQTSEMLIRNQYYLFIEFAPPITPIYYASKQMASVTLFGFPSARLFHDGDTLFMPLMLYNYGWILP